MRSRFKFYWLEASSRKEWPSVMGKGRGPSEEFHEPPPFDCDIKQFGSSPRLGSFEIDNLYDVTLSGPGIGTFQDQIPIQPGAPQVQVPVNAHRIAEAPGKEFAVPGVPDASVVPETEHEFAHGIGPRLTLQKN